MSPIDSISKQQELEKFLSPNWIESPDCLSYSKRFIVVHLHRLRYFFKDLFIHHQFKYRNDRWAGKLHEDLI